MGMAPWGIQLGAPVLVKWRDARFYSEIRRKDNLSGIRMAVFESVGFLVSEDITTTIIAAEQNDEDEYRDITLIPTRSIEEMKRLFVFPPPEP